MSVWVKIQLGLAAVALLGVGAFFLWLKFKPRAELGGACNAAIDCREGAEYCLKKSGASKGVCTKQCDTDADCGSGLACERTAILETITDAQSNDFGESALD